MKNVLLWLSLSLVLTGCSQAIASPIELIKKPRLPINQEFPREIIDDNLPVSGGLIRPQFSDALSSVDYLNWDDDQEDEVYAFYEDTLHSTVGVMIVDKAAERWRLRTEATTLGSDIHYAKFIDFNQDGIKELVLGVTMSDDYFNNLVVFAWQDDHYVEIYSDAYIELVVEDFDDDAISEILILKLDRNQAASASLLEYSENTLAVVDQVEMDEFINGYYNVIYGNVDRQTKGVFVDKKIGSKSATNIIVYDGHKLRLVFDEFNTAKHYKDTIKDRQIKSQDINGDGLIEIGNVIMSHIYNQDDPLVSAPYLNTWYNWTNSQTLSLTKMNYISSQDAFRLDFPDRWAAAVVNGDMAILTPRPDAKRGFLSVYYTVGEQLFKVFSIEVLSEQQYQERLHELSKDGVVYYALGNRDGKYYIGYSNLQNDTLADENIDYFQSLQLSRAEVRKLFQLLD